MSMIWDREEWPDTERTLRTFPGNPIQSIEYSGVIMSESSSDILMETGTQISIDYSPEQLISIRLNLDTTFPRIYLSEFTNDAYKKNTIEDTYVKIVNPFYIQTQDGTRVSSSEDSYKFTYLTSADSFGEYIINIDISVPNGTVLYPAYGGQNHPLTSKLVFQDNLNLIVCLESGALQGLKAYNNDTRNTTRATEQVFIVEDFNDKNDILSGGTAVNQEVSYLRFYNDGEKFITYKKTCPRLFGIAYDFYTTYSVGSQVYYDPFQGSSSYDPTSLDKVVNGNLWNAVIASGQAVAPANTSSNWSIVELPYRFKDYLVNGVASDFLRSEGRFEEANLFDQLAEAAIQLQIDVLLRQQGQVQRMDMVYTY
jgi:hypothetical protein